MKNPTFKLATSEDFDEFWDLFVESLEGNETQITRANLRQDLFGQEVPELAGLPEELSGPAIKLDLSRARSSAPVCQVMLARLGDSQVGFMMFHNFYSPWKGRKAYIDQVYVKPKHRNTGEFESSH